MPYDAITGPVYPLEPDKVPGIPGPPSFVAQPDDSRVDPAVACSRCEAVCCRLTVVVMPEDKVPRHFIEREPGGLEVMAHGEDGWCAALDRVSMCCGIYEQRPDVCRRFAMGGGYCRSVREDFRLNPPLD